MTGYADGQSITTQYELDNGRVLAAKAGDPSTGSGQVLTTTYLYGLGPIAELTDTWTYSLPDGANTPRQLANASGEVTLASSYTPWGDTLSVSGTGNFSFGYFGGIMDTATGLIYVGNGQYYDPETGRFLNRNAKPDQTNPYVPWGGEPTGALFAPLALLVLIYGRKKRNKWDNIVILLVMCMAVGMSLSACVQPTPTPTSTSGQNDAPSQPPATETPQPGNASGSNSTPDNTPTVTPTPCTPTPTVTPTPVSINCNELSDFRAKTACRTYHALLNHPEGWWTTGSWNGNRSGPLSPQAFAGLLLRMEFNGMGGTEFNKISSAIQQETVVRNFYAYFEGNMHYKGDTRNAYDILNFIGYKKMLELRPNLKMAENADFATISAKWRNGVDEKANYSNVDFEYALLHPGAWVDGKGQKEPVKELGGKMLYLAPMDWGNITMIRDHSSYVQKVANDRYNEAHGLINNDEGKIEKAEGKDENRFLIVRGGGDSVTVVTCSQKLYWQGSC